jgi:hypothetical protein
MHYVLIDINTGLKKNKAKAKIYYCHSLNEYKVTLEINGEVKESFYTDDGEEAKQMSFLMIKDEYINEN